ncbi:DNA-directed RNA polymerase subunit omega [Peptoniphilus sp. KCTC 25270]|uniref:DNA-directed RNA polymerase subunit omega n=1 Tax=Peptoniphilus sp. KCTC 25270 TaxID=2897414 RepID=UPI001E553AA6|nr:DNA-directed RNA polymerase subunit omega [Peptoniphilus sp. KCTC 25270]MCD1147119.1 DNA-directed RNA polymerase subunit omega [Peptoniphilus sp. KCTC 25270]
MNILSFGEISKISNSRYSLVMLVSKRAREIVDGDEPLVETTHERPVSIALDEASQGAISFCSKEEEEAQRALWKEMELKEAERLESEKEFSEEEMSQEG